jgi:hypothetical protein
MASRLSAKDVSMTLCFAHQPGFSCERLPSLRLALQTGFQKQRPSARVVAQLQADESVKVGSVFNQYCSNSSWRLTVGRGANVDVWAIWFETRNQMESSGVVRAG